MSTHFPVYLVISSDHNDYRIELMTNLSLSIWKSTDEFSLFEWVGKHIATAFLMTRSVE